VKLYIIDPASKKATLAPSVRTPNDVLAAFRQMEADGVADPETIRETLTKLGFKPKK
jgi:hypothetical protein